MMLPDYLKKYPNCQHLLKEKKCCSWLSGSLGREVNVSSMFCQTSCKKDGAYCGQIPKDETSLLYYAWMSIWGLNPKFIARVLKHYNYNSNISIPNEWENIKNALNFLYKFDSNLQAILLTGSIITDASRPLKDFDVALWYYDAKRMIQNKEETIKLLPKKINSIDIDYWYICGHPTPDVFFSCLDSEKKILYPSKWFNLKLNSIQEDITIVDVSTTELHKMIGEWIKNNVG